MLSEKIRVLRVSISIIVKSVCLFIYLFFIAACWDRRIGTRWDGRIGTNLIYSESSRSWGRPRERNSEKIQKRGDNSKKCVQSKKKTTRGRTYMLSEKIRVLRVSISIIVKKGLSASKLISLKLR